MPGWDVTLALLSEHAYALLFLLVLLDTVGLPLPAEALLVAFGVLASTQDLELSTGIGAASAGAVLGDIASYTVGRLGGQRLLAAYCRMARRTPECVEHMRDFHARFGRLTIVLGRFVIGLRVLAMPLAGTMRFPFAQFLVLDIAGAVVWSATFAGLGALLGSRAAVAAPWLAGGLAIAIATAFALAWLRRRPEPHRAVAVSKAPGDLT